MTNDSELLGRITVRTDVFGGKPIIRDMFAHRALSGEHET